MALKIKEHSFEFRNLGMKHFFNGDSEHEIATKNVSVREIQFIL